MWPVTSNGLSEMAEKRAGRDPSLRLRMTVRQAISERAKAGAPQKDGRVTSDELGTKAEKQGGADQQTSGVTHYPISAIGSVGREDESSC